MHQRALVPAGPAALLCVLSACLLISSGPAAAQTSGNPPEVANVDTPTVTDHQNSGSGRQPKILMVLGLKEAANKLVEIAIAEEFTALDVQQVDATVAASRDFRWPVVDIVVTAGRNGCLIAMQAVHETEILCTLLTEEGFASLDTGGRDDTSASLSALVIDQPASRQMRVANRTYPSLAQFSLFSGYGTGIDAEQVQSGINQFTFRTNTRLPAQLSDILSASDALIATSDSTIYNASTLSTVLLTAYGYEKPVIGFSRAYVKAGALLTCYSTPGQVLRQVAQNLIAKPISEITDIRLHYPDYFSVVDNPRVARSLGLVMEFSITPGKTYTDVEFKP